MALFLISYFIFINGLSAYLMYLDKQKAIEKAWRIPEGNLLMCCFAGGFLGTYWGVKYARHKSKHWQFHTAIIVSAFLWLGVLGFYVWIQR